MFKIQNLQNVRITENQKCMLLDTITGTVSPAMNTCVTIRGAVRGSSAMVDWCGAI
jgi:hypothetical protein